METEIYDELRLIFSLYIFSVWPKERDGFHDL